MVFQVIDFFSKSIVLQVISAMRKGLKRLSEISVKRVGRPSSTRQTG